MHSTLMYYFISNLRAAEDVKYYMLTNKLKFPKFQMKNLKSDPLLLRASTSPPKTKSPCLKHTNSRISKTHGLVMHRDQGFLVRAASLKELVPVPKVTCAQL